MDDAAKSRLENARAMIDRASITTIHGFCHDVLVENAFLNGGLFDERHVDERDAFPRAFKEVLRSELARQEELLPYLVAWLEIRGASVEALESILFDAARHRAPIAPGFDAERLAHIVSEMEAKPMTENELSAAGVARGSIAKVFRNLEAFNDALFDYKRSRDIARLVAELDDVELRYLDGKIGGFAELADGATSLSTAVVERFLPIVLDHLDRSKRSKGLFDYDDMLRRVDESLDGPARP